VSDATRGAVGGAAATFIQASWNARRMLRGRTVWVAIVFAVLPVAYTYLAGMNGDRGAWSDVFPLIVMLAALIAPLFMASSMAEEIEDRTYTYLWSRPVPRWSVVMGKLCASIPIAGSVVAAAVIGCFLVGKGASGEQLGRGIAAVLAGTVVACAVSAALAILFPRGGLVLTYVYLLALDLPIGAVPFSLRNAALTHQIRVLAGVSGVEPPPPLWQGAVWLAGIAAVWLAIAFWRLRRAEFSSGEK
jgi:ABC-type transport system involved in multi-copper enzyme maturation permease subunit